MLFFPSILGCNSRLISEFLGDRKVIAKKLSGLPWIGQELTCLPNFCVHIVISVLAPNYMRTAAVIQFLILLKLASDGAKHELQNFLQATPTETRARFRP